MLPNLFRFATSELSQDAVLCWLMAWAEHKHKESHPHLHEVAKCLLLLICSRAKINVPVNFQSIDIRRQDGGIDILCVINKEIAILIEDKVGTKQHSDQLERYKKQVIDMGFTDDKVVPVYIQTGDQSDYSEAAKHKYLTLTRRELLGIFEGESAELAKSRSEIFRDFSDYLRYREDEVQSYLKLPLFEWSWSSWMGFYTTIQEQLGEGNWDYVSNPSGGFLGFWWNFISADECKLYLQLEQEKFCFKISVDNPNIRKDRRVFWYDRICAKCPEYGLKAKRPNRFGSGQSMTVAILDHEYRALNDNGFINLADTLKILKSAQSVIKGCLSNA